MEQKDLREIHKLLLENVREENEKERKEISNSSFNINSKNNLISVAKEALKPKVLKQVKIKNNSTSQKINKSIGKKTSKITSMNDNFKNNIFSNKQYLNFMINDLKIISSSITKQQNKYYSSYTKDNRLLPNIQKRNKYFIYEGKKGINLKRNNMKKGNYNTINLLNQIIGDNDNDNEIEKYDNNTTTENNNYFNNLCYDNNEERIYIKEKDSNNNY